MALKRKSLKSALLGAQRQALLKLCKAYRTVSAEACCVVAGVLPLDILMTEKDAIFMDLMGGVPRKDSRSRRRLESLAL